MTKRQFLAAIPAAIMALFVTDRKANTPLLRVIKPARARLYRARCGVYRLKEPLDLPGGWEILWPRPSAS